MFSCFCCNFEAQAFSNFCVRWKSPPQVFLNDEGTKFIFVGVEWDDMILNEPVKAIKAPNTYTPKPTYDETKQIRIAAFVNQFSKKELIVFGDNRIAVHRQDTQEICSLRLSYHKSPDDEDNKENSMVTVGMDLDRQWTNTIVRRNQTAKNFQLVHT